MDTNGQGQRGRGGRGGGNRGKSRGASSSTQSAFERRKEYDEELRSRSHQEGVTTRSQSERANVEATTITIAEEPAQREVQPDSAPEAMTEHASSVKSGNVEGNLPLLGLPVSTSEPLATTALQASPVEPAVDYNEGDTPPSGNMGVESTVDVVDGQEMSQSGGAVYKRAMTDTSPSDRHSSTSSSKSSRASTIEGKGPYHRMWVPFNAPEPFSQYAAHYSFLKNMWVALSTCRWDPKWRNIVGSALIDTLRGQWVLNVEYWIDADEELQSGFVALLEDCLPDNVVRPVNMFSPEALIRAYLQNLMGDFDVSFEDLAARRPPKNWPEKSADTILRNCKGEPSTRSKAVKRSGITTLKDLETESPRASPKGSDGRDTDQVFKVMKSPSDDVSKVVAQSSAQVQTKVSEARHDQSPVFVWNDSDSDMQGWKIAGTSEVNGVPAKVFSKEGQGPPEFKYRTVFAEQSNRAYNCNDEKAESLFGVTKYTATPYGNFTPMNLDVSAPGAGPVFGDRGVDSDHHESASQRSRKKESAEGSKDRPKRSASRSGTSTESFDDGNADDNSRRQVRPNYSDGDPSSTDSSSDSSSHSHRAPVRWQRKLPNRDHGGRSNRRDHEDATGNIKEETAKMRAWSTMVRDKRLESAQGRTSWTEWIAVVNHAQYRCKMTDYEFITWLPDALSGHASNAWYLLANPYIDTDGTDMAVAAKVQARCRRSGAKRQALKWLKDTLFDNTRLHAMEMWNKLRFVRAPKIPFHTQVDSFFMKVRSCQDSLPDGYRDSVHLFDKLHTCFSRFGFYVKSSTVIDPTGRNAPRLCLAKFKKSYDDMRQLKLIEEAAKDMSFEASFAANEERLRRQTGRATGHRHLLHRSAPGKNPVGKDGKVMKCSGCGSLEHFFAKCESPKKFEYRDNLKKNMEGLKGRRYQNAAYSLFHNELQHLEQTYGLASGDEDGMSRGSSGHTSSPVPEQQELAEGGADCDSPVQPQGELQMDESFWTEYEDNYESFFVDEAVFHQETSELATVCAPNPNVTVFHIRRH